MTTEAAVPPGNVDAQIVPLDGDDDDPRPTPRGGGGGDGGAPPTAAARPSAEEELRAHVRDGFLTDVTEVSRADVRDPRALAPWDGFGCVERRFSFCFVLFCFVLLCFVLFCFVCFPA